MHALLLNASDLVPTLSTVTRQYNDISVYLGIAITLTTSPLVFRFQNKSCLTHIAITPVSLIPASKRTVISVVMRP